MSTHVVVILVIIGLMVFILVAILVVKYGYDNISDSSEEIRVHSAPQYFNVADADVDTGSNRAYRSRF
jgi:hypothetical protein